MIASRRVFLAGSAAVTAMTLTGAFASSAGAPPILRPANLIPANLIPPGMDSLVLHHGDAPALAFVRDVRLASQYSRIDDCPVKVLARGGFAQVGLLLDRASGRAVVALLDDADALVIEGLLRLRNARAVAHRRYGRQALLTARV